MTNLEYLLHPLGLVWIWLWLMALRSAKRFEPRVMIGFLVPAILIWIVGGTPVSYHLLARLEKPYERISTSPLPVVDAVVMLGGTHDYTRRGVIPFNTGESADRILAALELVRSGRATQLVLGGSGYEIEGQRRPDSELLLQWIQRWKLATGRIHLLGDCQNTHEEAIRTARLAASQKWRRLIVVSTASHLRRAEAVFQKQGLEVIPVGCDFAGLDGVSAGNGWHFIPRLRGLTVMNTYLHEEIGWWYYRWKGWVAG